MRIRTKLLLTTSAFLCSMLVVMSIAMWTIDQIGTLKRTIDSGNQLIAESEDIRGLLRDLLFGMFSPQVYFLLEDLTYVPGAVTTPRQWMSSVDRFQSDFNTFMTRPSVRGLLRDSEMRDKYAAAMTISRKAFTKIDQLNKSLVRIQSLNILGKDDVYKLLQSSNDDQVVSFFDEVRSTSYYFVNTFESFLGYFLQSLTHESDLIERQILLTFIFVTIALGLFTVGVSLYFARRITESIAGVERTIRQVSLGDFSAHLELSSHDEFGNLSTNLNLFIKDLKRNVDSILSLMRDVGVGATDKAGVDGILALVAESVVKDLRTSGAAVFLLDATGASLRLRASAGSFPIIHGRASSTIPLDDPILGAPVVEAEPLFVRDASTDRRFTRSALDGARIRSVIALPFVVSRRVRGVLSTASLDSQRPLNDLDLTNLRTFADYTALALENSETYAELVRLREAEYHALQSQVQPHFLYNILAGFVGLNRLGDRETLERSILALRDMLRYTVEHQKWATVEEELEFVRRYCELQRLRFRERLEIAVTCDGKAAYRSIPKLLLQPLVENAIIHGIEPLDRTGHLSVSAVVDEVGGDGALIILVVDDGVGYEVRPIDHEHHVGLANVRERLLLAYREAHFTVATAPGSGTRVEIVIPSGGDG